MVTTTSGEERRLRWPANGLSGVLDYAVASHRRAVLLLIAAALISFLPGFFQIPPVDRDEARFAQATKQMVESGDYVDIRFQDEVRYKKPVGIYWLQAAVVDAAEAVGVRNAVRQISLYRIPSLIGATGAVLLTYWAALAFVSRRAALLAGLMMATSILLGVEARLAKTDAMLLATCVAAMGVMARAYLGERKPPKPGLAGFALPAVFWIALAGGILLKGPVILLFVGLCAITLAIADRQARWLMALRPIPGIIGLFVLVLPWFVAIMSRSGSEFFQDSVGQDLFSKIISSQEAHGAPPGTYFVLFWLTFWPGATLAVMAAPSVWASRREKGAKFLLAWIVPAWILLELVVTKLPHYVLPLYPAIAILISGIVDPHLLARERWMTRGTGWWFVLPVIVGVAGIVGAMVLGRQLGLLAWPFAVAAMIMGLRAWRLYAADGAERSLLRGMVASILISVTVFGVLMPSIPALFPSVALARAVRNANCPNPVAAAVGYHEPSLVFLAGTKTFLAEGFQAADFLRQGGCRFALIEARQERGFLRRADAIGLRYKLETTVDGVNISIGKTVSIAVYRAEPSP